MKVRVKFSGAIYHSSREGDFLLTDPIGPAYRWNETIFEVRGMIYRTADGTNSLEFRTFWHIDGTEQYHKAPSLWQWYAEDAVEELARKAKDENLKEVK